MTSKQIDRMIGILGKPKIPYMLKDSDGDKVINVLDCEPHNPKKQGLRHRLARKAARFIPGKKLREEAMESISHREQLAKARKKASRTAELEAVAETAKFRVTEKERRKREFIKGGGFFGATARGLTGTARAISKIQPPRQTTTAVVKKAVKARKKGKGGKKIITRTATVRSKPAIRSVSDLKFDMPNFNF